MPKQEVDKFLIYHFSSEELAQLSAHLVRNTQDLETLQDRKTQVIADFTAKIKAANAEIFKAARLIGNGYEYRDVKCWVMLDQPKKAMKQIIRQDTGEVVAEEAMTADELQYALDLDLEAAKEEIKHEDPPAEDAKPEPAPETEPVNEPQLEPPVAGPEPVIEDDEDDAPFDQEPVAPLPEPVRIAAAKDGWSAEIVILDTPAGFTAEASLMLKGGDLISIETPGVFLSEQECRTAAAKRIWEHARDADNKPGARRRVLRQIMAWATEQMVVREAGNGE
jgi:hypothetical protein